MHTGNPRCVYCVLRIQLFDWLSTSHRLLCYVTRTTHTMYRMFFSFFPLPVTLYRCCCCSCASFFFFFFSVVVVVVVRFTCNISVHRVNNVVYRQTAYVRTNNFDLLKMWICSSHSCRFNCKLIASAAHDLAAINCAQNGKTMHSWIYRSSALIIECRFYRNNTN